MDRDATSNIAIINVMIYYSLNGKHINNGIKQLQNRRLIMNSMYDSYTLSNGMQIPCMGFGTYNAKDGDNYEIIKTAIKAGYRYFDTASFYFTENDLGRAIKDSGIDRKEFFIVSKAWINQMGYDNVKKALRKTLNNLDMDYLDLYLIHWPKVNEDDDKWKERQKETWQAMEEMCDEGLIRGIGLSNFLPHHLDNILSFARIKPLVDQLEFHPGYTQEAAVSYCRENDVRVQAWSPLGRAVLLDNAIIKNMAAKYNVSPSQICLRYCVQREIIPLVKTSTMERMLQNKDIFGFEISKEDMHIIDCMPQAGWSGEHPDFAIPKVNADKLLCD